METYKTDWAEWEDISEMLGADGWRKGDRNSITATIRVRYDDDEDFEGKTFYLQLQAPRGFGKRETALQGIVKKYGKRHYSDNRDELTALAEQALAEAETI